MPDAKRTIKITTEQAILEDAESSQPGFPLRHWTMQITLIHQETKQEIPADCFQKVLYKLHPSFGNKEKQVRKSPPFRIEEDGWGEFELQIFLTDLTGKDHPIQHDLHFREEHYETKHVITFKNPKGELAATLRASGSVPGDPAGELANGKKGGRASGIGAADGEAAKKKKKNDMRGIDMDLLAEKLQKLGEDDLLQVVEMVHENKTENSWMRNDVDQGEFHVDLYTLPESLIKMLWDFTSEKSTDEMVSALERLLQTPKPRSTTRISSLHSDRLEALAFRFLFSLTRTATVSDTLPELVAKLSPGLQVGGKRGVNELGESGRDTSDFYGACWEKKVGKVQDVFYHYPEVKWWAPWCSGDR